MRAYPYRFATAAALMLGVASAHAADIPVPAAADIATTFATTSERAALLRKLRETDILPAMRGPVTSSTESQFSGALWAAGLINDTSPDVRAGVAKLLQAYPTLGPRTRRETLDAVHGLFQKDFAAETEHIAATTTVPREMAMAVTIMLHRAGSAALWPKLRAQVQERFPNWKESPHLAGLVHEWDRPGRDGLTTGGLVALLRHPFPNKLPVLFSIQRPGRDTEGIAIIRQSDGKFLRNADGSVFAIRQLARSNSAMPGIFSNGNTPRGLFVIQGVDRSYGNKFIGPTPLLVSELPFESSVARFLGESAPAGVTTWTQPLYQNLLPKEPIVRHNLMEAWYAGWAGRGEIIIHGTVIDPTYYANTTYFPATPSMGCLCAKEDWDTSTGALKKSDQLELVMAWKKACSAADPARGYLVVTEFRSPAPISTPLSLSDIMAIVHQAE